MLRLIGRRKAQRLVSNGTDEVLLGISLPSDTVIHDIRLRGQVLPDTNNRELNPIEVLTYAMEAWILPIDDPDATADFDDVWDTLVPKDSDVQTLDLDAETPDTNVFYEPGEADWQALFDLGLRPQRLFHTHKDLTINNTKGMRWIDSQSPFEPKWQAGDFFSWRDPKRYRVRNPSVLLIGFGIPANDDTVSVMEAPLAENEWGRVKYLGDTLKFAMMSVLGIVEPGAETPFEEAADLLQRHLDPDVMEETGGFFSQQILNTLTELTVDHSVPGELGIGSVTTGR